MQHLCR